MTKTLSYIAGVIFILLTTSCETDVDLIAPYDDTPIVFGVLDQTVDTQFIKVNKSFIGEGDNFAYAAIADCTIFKSVSGTVIEVGGDGRVFNLKEKFVKNIDEGIFYADSQKVYYFNVDKNVDPLDENATYELSLNINEGDKIVTSETSLVGDFSVDKFALVERLKFIDFDPQNNKVFNDEIPLKWGAGDQGQMFSAILRFYYDEYDLSGNITNRFIDIDMGTTSSSFKGDELTMSISGSNFFQKVYSDDHIESTSLDVIQKRIVRNIEYIISVANTTLKTYIDLNQPSTGIVQDRPSFTNVTVNETDLGRGVFSSRYAKLVDKSRFGSDVELDKLSIQELFESGLKFYTDDTAYEFSSNSGGCEQFFWKDGDTEPCP